MMCGKRKFESMVAPDTIFHGRIRTIAPDKGYGFIEGTRIRRIFKGNMYIHSSQIRAAGLQVGDPLTFKVDFDKNGRHRAKDVVRLERTSKKGNGKQEQEPSESEEDSPY
eukprot:TRINITY_DN26214_c0_g1_i2.p1 TRINITY_DN26214_c0_g1~~TRINITY_DN26214_c0_g1_i2.p1  ORF type:complete len:110 (-),score=16.26 TRINITY_DN26214_c0_g1_i2:20-349(-)